MYVSFISVPLFIGFLAVAGCASFPALDDRITEAARTAPYPSLKPLPTFEESASDVEDGVMAARIAALQARAARLRAFDIGALQ